MVEEFEELVCIEEEVPETKDDRLRIQTDVMRVNLQNEFGKEFVGELKDKIVGMGKSTLQQTVFNEVVNQCAENLLRHASGKHAQTMDENVILGCKSRSRAPKGSKDALAKQCDEVLKKVLDAVAKAETAMAGGKQIAEADLLNGYNVPEELKSIAELAVRMVCNRQAETTMETMFVEFRGKPDEWLKSAPDIGDVFPRYETQLKTLCEDGIKQIRGDVTKSGLSGDPYDLEAVKKRLEALEGEMRKSFENEKVKIDNEIEKRSQDILLSEAGWAAESYDGDDGA